jgi:hypothetical protein
MHGLTAHHIPDCNQLHKTPIRVLSAWPNSYENSANFISFYFLNYFVTVPRMVIFLGNKISLPLLHIFKSHSSSKNILDIRHACWLELSTIRHVCWLELSTNHFYSHHEGLMIKDSKCPIHTIHIWSIMKLLARECGASVQSRKRTWVGMGH